MEAERRLRAVAAVEDAKRSRWSCIAGRGRSSDRPRPARAWPSSRRRRAGSFAVKGRQRRGRTTTSSSLEEGSAGHGRGRRRFPVERGPGARGRASRRRTCTPTTDAIARLDGYVITVAGDAASAVGEKVRDQDRGRQRKTIRPRASARRGREASNGDDRDEGEAEEEDPARNAAAAAAARRPRPPPSARREPRARGGGARRMSPAAPRRRGEPEARPRSGEEPKPKKKTRRGTRGRARIDKRKLGRYLPLEAGENSPPFSALMAKDIRHLRRHLRRREAVPRPANELRARGPGRHVDEGKTFHPDLFAPWGRRGREARRGGAEGCAR